MSSTNPSLITNVEIDGRRYDATRITLGDGRVGYTMVPHEEEVSIFRCDGETIDTIDALSVLGPHCPLWEMNKNHANVAVAGSFLLHCRLKGVKGWSPNDVDVWCEGSVYDVVVQTIVGLTGVAAVRQTERTSRVGPYQIIRLDARDPRQSPWSVCSSFDFPVLNGMYAGGHALQNAVHQSDMRLTKDKVPDTPEFRARVAKYVARGFREPEYMTPEELAAAQRNGQWYYNSDYRGFFRSHPNEV
jgi:hypothetical protein